MEAVEEAISAAFAHMGLERNLGVHITADPPTESTCLVATPIMTLTRSARRRTATLDHLEGELDMSKDSTTLVILETTLKGVPIDDDDAPHLDVVEYWRSSTQG